MELLAELIIELVVQLFGQAILEALGRGLGAFAKSDAPAAVIARGVALGAVAGGASLLVRHAPVLTDPTARVANLVLAALLGGSMMALVDARLRKRSARLGFARGAAFALTFAGLRFVFAR